MYQQGPTVEHRELPGVVRQPGWEGSLGENRHMCMYNWVSSRFTWDYDNIVNLLYSKVKKKKKEQSVPTGVAFQIEQNLMALNSWEKEIFLFFKGLTDVSFYI